MRPIPPLACAALMTEAALAQERTRTLVKSDHVEINLIAEGRGPLIVLLRGRDPEDYDEVAAGLARDGFRVLRPQPRGMHASKGPLKGITLHDLARENAGPVVIVGHACGLAESFEPAALLRQQGRVSSNGYGRIK